MTESDSADRAGEATRWPFWSMLLYGHFATEATPESQRADLRSRVGVAVFLILWVVVVLVPGLDTVQRRHGTSALVGLLLAYLGWQRWRYTVALDELARRLYLEAFAITYLFGLALFSVAGSLQGMAGWTVSPLAFLALEPVRVAVLAWRSRRFA